MPETITANLRLAVVDYILLMPDIRHGCEACRELHAPCVFGVSLVCFGFCIKLFAQVDTEQGRSYCIGGAGDLAGYTGVVGRGEAVGCGSQGSTPVKVKIVLCCFAL